MEKPDAVTLASLYVGQGKSLRDIGSLYGVHATQVRRWLLQASIPTRSVSEGTRLSGKFGVHSEAHRESLRNGAAKARAKITDDSRRKQSETRKRLGLGGHNKGIPMSDEQRQILIEQRADPAYRRKMSERYMGEKSPNWKGGIKPEHSARLDRAEWKRIRQQVYARDNWLCQDCGRKCKNTADSRNDGKAKIQAHHLIARRDGGTDDLENLVTLCMSCHHKRERGRPLN